MRAARLVAILLATIAAAAEEAQTLFDRAKTQIDSGQTDAAITTLMELTAVAPEMKQAWTTLAIAYLEVKRTPEKAELVLADALSRFPDDAALHSLMGHAQLAGADACAGRACLDAAIAKADAARDSYLASIRLAANAKLKGANWLALASTYQLEAELLALQQPEVSARLRERAQAAATEAFSLDAGLRDELRQLQVDLLLPTPQRSRVYTRTHAAVNAADRREKVTRALQAATRTSDSPPTAVAAPKTAVSAPK